MRRSPLGRSNRNAIRNRTQVEDRDAENRQKRDQLWEAAKKARQAEDFAKAAELGEQMLAVEKGVAWRAKTLLCFNSLNWLADVYQQQKAWQKAIERRESAALLSENIHGENDWRTVDARLALRGHKITIATLHRRSGE